MPTGNFGNVCAGHVARMMGLPIRRLIVATNENDVLDEFFRTGRYGGRRSADVRATSSPSMDISKASNFERFVFDLVGRDPQTVAALWRELDAAGEFNLAGYRRTSRASGTSASSPGRARTPIGSRRSATWTAATASSSIRIPPTASRPGSRSARPAFRSCASRRRCR